jgi:hypothetical protein
MRFWRDPCGLSYIWRISREYRPWSAHQRERLTGYGRTSCPLLAADERARPAKAGVGSAVNDSTWLVGGTPGVAVIGSVYASVYGSRLTATTPAHVPGPVASIAHQSVGAAYAAAGKIAALGRAADSTRDQQPRRPGRPDRHHLPAAAARPVPPVARALVTSCSSPARCHTTAARRGEPGIQATEVPVMSSTGREHQALHDRQRRVPADSARDTFPPGR